MELKLRTGFTKMIASKIIGKVIRKKLGLDVKVKLNELEVVTDENGVSHVKLSIEGDMKKEELDKVVNMID